MQEWNVNPNPYQTLIAPDTSVLLLQFYCVVAKSEDTSVWVHSQSSRSWVVLGAWVKLQMDLETLVAFDLKHSTQRQRVNLHEKHLLLLYGPVKISLKCFQEQKNDWMNYWSLNFQRRRDCWRKDLRPVRQHARLNLLRLKVTSYVKISF